MGATLPFRNMTNAQLQAHIRHLAMDSGRVVFTLKTAVTQLPPSEFVAPKAAAVV